MTTYFVQPSSPSISEASSAPAPPSPGRNVPRYGTIVPNRIFVGGISTTTTEEELKEIFSRYGTIKEIKIIIDRGGVCKGFGFITFETAEEAKRVQDEKNGIFLKERRLNVAPAIIKQQIMGRQYDVVQQGGALLYHNGTPYTYHNGMAIFPTTGSGQVTYGMNPSRDAAAYAATFASAHGHPTHAGYPTVLYPAYAPHTIQYLPGQQYQYQPIPFEYFKTLGSSASQYIYSPSNTVNGTPSTASQSPPTGYGPSAPPGPGQNCTGPQSGSHGMTNSYYHTGSDMYFNNTMPSSGSNPVYHVDSSPGNSEEWSQEPRQAGTPVVSLLKLNEARDVEEMELTRSPRKFSGGGTSQPSQYAGAGVPRSGERSRRSVPHHGRGRSVTVLAGQRSTSAVSPASAASSCTQRSASLSPSGQMPIPYGAAGRPNSGPFYPKRGINSSRYSGSRHTSGNFRGNVSQNLRNGSYPSAGSKPAPGSTNGKVSPQHLTEIKSDEATVNGMKSPPLRSPVQDTTTALLPSSEATIADKGAAGDACVDRTLFISSPDGSFNSAPKNSNEKAGGDAGEIQQKLQALAL